MQEHTAQIGGHLVFWRSAERAGSPILWVHGVPDSSDLWLPLLERAGGIALDLPGFGRSGKRGDFPYTIDGYADFLLAFLDELGVQRFRLVCHDWGVVALAMAMRRPSQLERLVAIDVVPFLPEYRWHLAARLWRRRVVGELVMGATTGWAMRRWTGNSKEWTASVTRHFDHGTQRAILRLYRSADPAVLESAGARLPDLGAPALVVWGERDPYIPARFAADLAARLPRAEVLKVTDRGHWPWLGDGPTAARIVEFATA
jgi:pimeloyl-ACP methyl ester carboxylesterase